MALIAKIVDPDGSVRDYVFENEDPNDQEISMAMGEQTEGYVIIGEENGYEILGQKSHESIMVIGSAPQMSASVKMRKSFSEQNAYAEGLVRNWCS